MRHRNSANLPTSLRWFGNVAYSQRPEKKLRRNQFKIAEFNYLKLPSLSVDLKKGVIDSLMGIFDGFGGGPMKLRALLLGSAASMALTGTGQAADLMVYSSEAADYVRVCEAFGEGYYYIPGTDTCLRIGGYVQFEVTFFADKVAIGEEEDHETNWISTTEANLQFEARSQTDWGDLIAYIELEGAFDSGGDTGDAFFTETYINLGALTVGRTQSFFDYGGGYTLSGLDDGLGDGTGFTDNKVNQIQLAWDFDQLGLVVAVEDPRTRASDWLDCASCAGDIPDLVAGLTFGFGSVSGQVAFLYADWGAPSPDNVWGVQGGFEIEEIFGTDMLKLAATYLESGGGEVWGVLGSYEHFWTSMVSSALTVRYDDTSGSGGFFDGPVGCGCENVGVAFDTKIWPVENFLIAGEVGWFQKDPTAFANNKDTLVGRIRLERQFNTD